MACGQSGSVNAPSSPTPANSPVAAATPTPDPFAASRELFSDKCADCHQENGEGGPVKIEGHRLNVPALTRGHALGHTDEKLALQISKGGGGMPGFKERLKSEEIQSLVDYIRKTFQSGGKAESKDMHTDSLNSAPSDMKKMPMNMPQH
jgi:mono/diheme cytochrome c family protein